MKFLILLFLSLSLNAQVYFSPEDSLSKVVITQIKKAQKSIDLSIYSFSSKDIRQALIEQLNNGLTIRLIVHKATDKRIREFLQPLLNSGAVIKYVSKINHHKFMITDGVTLYNSSGNMSSSSRMGRYDENSFMCSNTCPQLVTSYQQEFNYLLHHGKFLGIGPMPESLYRKQESISTLFTSRNFQPKHRGKTVTFKVDPLNPSGHVTSKLIEAIEMATSSLQVATGHFRSWPLFKALERAVQRGVKVELYMDAQEYISKSRHRKEQSKIASCIKAGDSEQHCSKSGIHYSRSAVAAGIKARIKYYSIRWYFPKAPQMHSKYMIVDGKVLYTGSYNWSYNAEFNTFENIAIITDQNIVDKYQRNFKNIFTQRPSAISQLFTNAIQAEKQLPLFFSPVSLNIAQIDSILSTYRKKCPSLYKTKHGQDFCTVK